MGRIPAHRRGDARLHRFRPDIVVAVARYHGRLGHRTLPPYLTRRQIAVIDSVVLAIYRKAGISRGNAVIRVRFNGRGWVVVSTTLVGGAAAVEACFRG